MAPHEGRPGRWDGHLLLLHHTDAQRRSGLVAWLRRGLRLGAKIVYTEPADGSADHAFLRLAKTHAETQEALDRGQVEVIEVSEELYDSGWLVGKIRQALSDGYSGLRWAGEASSALSVMSPDSHLEVERATDELCLTQPLSVLCQYPATQPPERLRALCATHGGGVNAPLLRACPVDNGVALAGEVDGTNQQVLASFLESTTAAHDPHPFVVDLSELEFVDVSGVRALMSGTDQFRRRGGSIRLRDPRRHVERVTRLVLCAPTFGFGMEPA